MKNKVVSNASWIIGTHIARSVLSLIIGMITARYLGPSNYGIINYASSVVAFVVPIMNMGLTRIMVQELVNQPEKEGEIIGSALSACAVSSVFCVLGAAAFVNIANRGETETIIVCALYSIIVFLQVFDILHYWFQARLMSKYTSLVSIAAYIVVSGYKIFILATGKSVRWFAVSNSLDYFLIALMLLVLYKKLGGQRFSFSGKLLGRMLHKSKYYIISSMMITVFANTDRVMLKIMVGESAVGYYSAAVTCAGLTGFVVSAIIDSARPVVFRYKMNDERAFDLNMRRLYSVVIYFALLQSLVMTLFAKQVVLILFGSDYIPAVRPLRVVVWYTTFSYIGAVRNVWLLAELRQNVIWKIDLSGALANILLNAVLIPRYGATGAAVASLATQFFANVAMVAIFKESRPNIRLMLRSLSPRVLFDVAKLLRRG